MVAGMGSADAMLDALAQLGRSCSSYGWAAVGGGVALAALVALVLVARIYVVPPRLRMKGKVVIITGGSSGIGKAVAKEVLGHGADVILVARDEDKLTAARAELLKEMAGAGASKGKGKGRSNNGEAAGAAPRVVLVSQDVAAGEEPLVQALSPAIEELGGRVDVLINCAGTSVSGAFDELVEEAFEDMYRVNVLGSVFPTRAVLPYMKRQRAGAIVFVSSQAGQVGLWGYSAYSASKFALRGLAQALQMEVHPFNIFVSVAYPPDTDTPGFQVEELSKPAETSMICGAGSVFPADHVARDLVKGLERRAFNVWTGLDGFMLSSLTCGMEPAFGLLPALVQVLTMSLFRLVSLFYLLDFYRISHRCSRDRQGAAGGGSDDGALPRKYLPKLPMSATHRASGEGAAVAVASASPPGSTPPLGASPSPPKGLGAFRRRKAGSGGSST